MFPKIPIVVFLSSKSITFPITTQHLSFSPSYMQHSEITDEKKYTEELQKFFQGFNKKQKKGIIIISGELIFSREVVISEKSEEEQMENFLAPVPLIKNNTSTISVNNKKSMQFFATNKMLYEVIRDVLEDNGVEIYSVVPITAFSSTNIKEITAEEAKKFARNKEILKKFNFLENREQAKIDTYSAPEEHILEDEPDKKNMKKQYILLVISLLLLTGAIGYLLLWSETIPNPWFRKPVVSKVAQKAIISTAPSVTSLPLPTAKLLPDKSLIKIQILNGSGIEGQAGEISSLLQKVGYKNIVTDNAKTPAQKTTITYTSQVPKSLLDNITEEIKKIFPNTIMETASSSAEYDVVIITGNK